MLRFIWKNWWRRKERFFLLLIGVLIISVGLTYLVGLSETNQGTIVDELEQRWKSSYDIVVRPEGSRSNTEQQDLLDPNYLSGIHGGISLDQYETIKEISNIDVAAPIAMIGFINYNLYLEPYDIEKTGVYRLIEDEITFDGIKETKVTTRSYFPSDDLAPYVLDENLHFPDYYTGSFDNHLFTMRELLLAGIDPEQEAKLIGLDKAIMPQGPGRYFANNDEPSIRSLGETDGDDFTRYDVSFPIIMSNQSYADHRINWRLERLNLPFDEEDAEEILDMIDEKGKKDYLETIQGEEVNDYYFNEQEIFSRLVGSIAGIDRKTGEDYSENYLSSPKFQSGPSLIFRPSPLMYESMGNPFPEKWQFSYQLKTFKSERGTNFRPLGQFDNEDKSNYYIQDIFPEWIGYYDPSKINISKDPTNELPMETYRPAIAELVLDPDENPINPPQTLQPSYDPFSFLANPPAMLTTLEAAEILSGDKPISAIRVKVAGVSGLTEESQAHIEHIAKEIEEKTGLITDITLGSSPQPTLVHVPELEGTEHGEELGWFQQPWIKLGSSITLFREAKIGFSGLIISIITVAAIYVWATSLVSLLTRRKEFAVLLAVGWRPRQLSRLLFLESAILGALVAMISWLILGSVTLTEGSPAEPIRIVLTGLFGFLVYIVGAIIPAYNARKITPYEVMQEGEISKLGKRFIRTKGIMSMALNHFIGKWKRALLSIVTIAIPTSLLAIFLFITFRLKGIMYTTWLGQYVALEVGPVHYTAIGVALMIAILTTAEIMWQNIAERGEEIALLKAVGWKNRSVRLLIWMEGLFSGIVAAVIGLTLAFFIQRAMYGEVTLEELKFVFATGIVPIVVGILGTILPAERATRISPIHGLSGKYSNRKSTEKWLKWMIALAFVVLLAAVAQTLIMLAK